MNLNALINNAVKPELYAKGTDFMWTDSHISKQLLQVHLNEDIDLASRKKSSILQTTEWILYQTGKEQLSILDLGCGPGLYTTLFAEQNHNVTGIDISEESIRHARTSTEENNLSIDYRNGSYLEIDLEESKYDLIVMIYTDFGVLSPAERNLLLQKIRRALKVDGIFIFDALNVSCFVNCKAEQSWKCEKSGFWSNKPYLHLSQSFIYEDKKLLLYRHLLTDESDTIRTFHFWTHFFVEHDLANLLSEQALKARSFHRNVLPEENLWNGKNVTFTVCTQA